MQSRPALQPRLLESACSPAWTDAMTARGLAVGGVSASGRERRSQGAVVGRDVDVTGEWAGQPGTNRPRMTRIVHRHVERRQAVRDVLGVEPQVVADLAFDAHHPEPAVS